MHIIPSFGPMFFRYEFFKYAIVGLLICWHKSDMIIKEHNGNRSAHKLDK